jgi:hypothetical protein
VALQANVLMYKQLNQTDTMAARARLRELVPADAARESASTSVALSEVLLAAYCMRVSEVMRGWGILICMRECALVVRPGRHAGYTDMFMQRWRTKQGWAMVLRGSEHLTMSSFSMIATV